MKHTYLNVNVKPPCDSDCEGRTSGCHGTCEKYKQYTEELEKERKKKAKYEEKMTHKRYGRRHYGA